MASEAEIRSIVRRQREYFYSGRTLPVTDRVQALERLARCEDLLSSLEREQAELSEKLEALKVQGRQKTVQFRELMARKLVNQQLRLRLEEYKLLP